MYESFNQFMAFIQNNFFMLIDQLIESEQDLAALGMTFEKIAYTFVTAHVFPC